jgi:peroxiredoxin
MKEAAMAEPQVGDAAPDFSLRDQDNRTVKLSELRGGKVLLVFYPLDFSPTCTEEVCALRDNFGDFQRRGVRVYGVSRDSRYTHKAWKEQQKLPFDLLADVRGEAARSYGVWPEGAYYSSRVSFLIDEQGRVAGRVGGDNDVAPDHQPILEAV